NFQSKKDADKSFVDYQNALGSFEDPHTIKCQYFKSDVVDSVNLVTGKYIVIATGGRPKISNFPGAHEYCITSDDLFSLPYNPGKTVVVGASYVALECAGFLKGFGF
ncbi:FAD-dependent oxidoreductase, partial [Salmonella sp. s51228]|uniref:FAD-dependent oxidoreductase n=1 Tax=Salmonella sp. s51228 TaxID=3159652 RepID=UPI00398072D4